MMMATMTRVVIPIIIATSTIILHGRDETMRCNQHLNILLKVTNACNLRCTYCFHAGAGYEGSLLDAALAVRFIGRAAVSYDSVNIVFHGGEPLLAPDSFFEKVVTGARAISDSLSFSLQTNGTLLLPQRARFLNSLGIHFGISYDGLAHADQRGEDSTSAERVRVLLNEGFKVGALCVVYDLQKYSLLDQYKHFNELGLSVKFNPLLGGGAAISNDLNLFDYELYATEYMSLFKTWIADAGCRIGIDNYFEVIDAIAFDQLSNCLYTSCLGKWLCVDPHGDVYPCDRLTGQAGYCLGNISEDNCLESAFSSPSFADLVLEAIDRKRSCRNTCEVYDWCNGGCNAEAIYSGRASVPNPEACRFRRRVLKGLEEEVQRICKSFLRSPSEVQNPVLRAFLKRRFVLEGRSARWC